MNSGIRVLHVDDSPRERRLMEEFAPILGWRLRSVADGREAMHALEQEQWDLVISDVQMPVMDGIALAQEMRLYPTANAETPLVLATGMVSDMVLTRADQLGVERVLAKPLLLNTLRLLEDQLFGVSRRAAE